MTLPADDPSVGGVPAEPVAQTAGEENHDDPWAFASEEYVDAPTDTGRPADGA